MKRNGGWTIELANPIGGLSVVELQPLQLDHTIRWARHDIPSVLALIAELSGVKEKQLKQLTGGDIDRIFIAFSFIASGTIKSDFDQGKRPLSTPLDLMSEEDRYAELDENDPIDPRFPKVDEPVKRFKDAPPEPQPPAADGGMNINPPEVLKKVG